MSNLYLIFGASRGCAFYATLSLLPQPATGKIVLLLRNAATFLDNKEFKHLEEKVREKVVVIKGDATKLEDVKKVFEKVVELEGTSASTNLKCKGIVFGIGEFDLPLNILRLEI